MNAAPSRNLFDRVQNGQVPYFALIARSTGSARECVTIDVFAGAVAYPSSLGELPLPALTEAGADHQELLVLVPYRQLHERGFKTYDDGAPLIAIICDEHETVSAPLALAAIPDVDTTLGERHFDIDDEAYAEIVERVITDEIGTGAGSNFVIKRTLEGNLDDYSPAKALTVFKRLMRREVGAYWIFVIHTGERTFVGATPERHLTLHEGRATMNPISGTYRYPQSGPTIDGINAFLGDRKESDELYMVLDEELKMMARICQAGGQVTGPHLREMARLAHTEYFIVGNTEFDVRDLLRETMFAPTVTGSPIESATRVIARHEQAGRGYYSGIAALIGRDARGERTLDSVILIRTAEIDRAGHVRIGVGSTLVRHSDAASEVMETHAKVAALSNAFDPPEAGPALGQHPSVQAALSKRNNRIADFWFRPYCARQCETANEFSELSGLRALIVDAEDNFTSMIAQQLSSLSLATEVCSVHDAVDLARYDVVVMGPGPGDPSDVGDPRIARLYEWLQRLIDDGKPFIAVCLSHQVLAAILGIPLVRREVPNQGIQVEIDLFGQRERVGFYNTYVARAMRDGMEVDRVGALAISRDLRTGEVHALRGTTFSSIQFHAESVLTVDGPRILGEAIMHALRHERALLHK